MKLKDDPRIAKAVSRLRAMGVRCLVDEVGDDVVVIFVDEDSIMEAMKRKIAQSINFPKFVIIRDTVERALIVYFWKGEMPKWIEEKIIQTR
jgi:inorganic pyrophosphatase